MNKEVIYLEPEDDITDILTKLQQAEQKLVALVPPKKATMLRSAINTKLVARVAKECEKIVVIVTADPAIVKMAMAARIPVAKTLNSRPVIPTEANVRAAEAEVQMIDEDGEDVTDDAEIKPQKAPKTAPEAPSEPVDERSDKTADTLDLTEESLENGSGERKKAKKRPSKDKKSKNSATGFAKYRKWLAIGIPALVVLAAALVWAFVFAPSATITVAVSSTPNNFSETVRFTTDPGAENIPEGVFLATKESIEQPFTVDIEPTGEENHGERATGNIAVTFRMRLADYPDDEFEIGVPSGTVFTNKDGRSYRATESSATLKWDGEFPIPCDTQVTSTKGTCVKTFTVPVEAVEPGEEYNILSSSSYWNDYSGASVRNSGAISGGTTKMIKTISEDDLDKARNAVIAEHTVEGREMLIEDLDADLVPIESSFAAEPGDVSSTPAVGEEIKEDEKPTAKITAKYSIYTIELSKIKQYIDVKITPAEDQKIYSYGKPYFERFTAIEEPARLKTVVEIGPVVTEESIFEKAAGRKTGEVQSQLRSINGVSSVEIRTPYFWVWSVPKDRNKVTINLKVEDRS